MNNYIKFLFFLSKSLFERSFCINKFEIITIPQVIYNIFERELYPKQIKIKEKIIFFLLKNKKNTSLYLYIIK
ncbi:hypothetical protein C4S76_00720 [Apibacter adventoris]|nr:hypothetical protein C4S76_00720 [Apibacter adventoris]